jgi:hypothetical protein
MSSRAQRRADASASRRLNRQIAGGSLDTCLIEAGSSLAGHKHERRFRETISDLYQDPRNVCCIICRSTLSSARRYGAFLLSTSARPGGIATASAICIHCIKADSAYIEIAATRALQHVIPGGRFIDPLPLPDTS